MNRSSPRRVLYILLPILAACCCMLFCSCGKPAYDGRTLRVLTYGRYAELYTADETGGGTVRDALYAVYRALAEDGITVRILNTGAQGYKSQTALLADAVSAGDDLCDLTLEHATAGPENALNGLFCEINALGGIGEKDAPHFSPQALHELTINGRCYLLSPASHWYGLGATKAIAVNRAALADRGLEFPGQEALDGAWTLEKLIALTRGTAEDTDGDGVYDFYGYASYAPQNFWLCCCGAELIERAADGMPALKSDTRRTADLIDRLREWYAGENILYAKTDPLTGLSRTDWQDMQFADGHALFSPCDIDTAASLFASRTDCSLLPLPKYEESQEDYHSFSSELFTAIPICAPDPAFSLDALKRWAALGYEKIYPAYLGTMPQRDGTEQALCRLIADTRTVSFPYTHEPTFGHLLTNLIDGTSLSGFAAYYAANRGAAQARLDRICAVFGDAG